MKTRIRATLLLAVSIALLGSVFVACEPFCCVFEGETEVHAAMPCCTESAAIARAEVVRVDAVAASGSIPAPQAVAIAAEPEPIVRVVEPLERAGEHAPDRHRASPPLFITHAQLLI